MGIFADAQALNEREIRRQAAYDKRAARIIDFGVPPKKGSVTVTSWGTHINLPRSHTSRCRYCHSEIRIENTNCQNCGAAK